MKLFERLIKKLGNCVILITIPTTGIAQTQSEFIDIPQRGVHTNGGLKCPRLTADASKIVFSVAFTSYLADRNSRSITEIYHDYETPSVRNFINNENYYFGDNVGPLPQISTDGRRISLMLLNSPGDPELPAPPPIESGFLLPTLPNLFGWLPIAILDRDSNSTLRLGIPNGDTSLNSGVSPGDWYLQGESESKSAYHISLSGNGQFMLVPIVVGTQNITVGSINAKIENESLMVIDTTNGSVDEIPVYKDLGNGKRYRSITSVDISSDGRFVVFSAKAFKLSYADSEDFNFYYREVLWFDRLTRQLRHIGGELTSTEYISSALPSISDDGMTVFYFSSKAKRRISNGSSTYLLNVDYLESFDLTNSSVKTFSLPKVNDTQWLLESADPDVRDIAATYLTSFQISGNGKVAVFSMNMPQRYIEPILTTSSQVEYLQNFLNSPSVFALNTETGEIIRIGASPGVYFESGCPGISGDGKVAAYYSLSKINGTHFDGEPIRLALTKINFSDQTNSWPAEGVSVHKGSKELCNGFPYLCDANLIPNINSPTPTATPKPSKLSVKIAKPSSLRLASRKSISAKLKAKIAKCPQKNSIQSNIWTIVSKPNKSKVSLSRARTSTLSTSVTKKGNYKFRIKADCKNKSTKVLTATGQAEVKLSVR